MVFADWTFSIASGSGSCALDAVEKHAGASSAKMSIGNHVNAPILRLTHDTFLEPQAQVIGWFRMQLGSSSSIPRSNVYHSSYGSIDTLTYATASTWEKFKFTFWYDIGSNTKWGRLEKYVATAWVQQGTDTNFGSGSPASGTVALEGKGQNIRNDQVVWFDEIDVYS